MLRIVCLLLLVLAFPGQILAAEYRPNTPLGELLEKTKSLSGGNNAGGDNILQNSCLNKHDFSMSASEEFLDHCDLAAATSQFLTKYGAPATTGKAPGNKTVLEYFLRYEENDYHVRVFLGCAAAKTEYFTIVECKAERNRFMPGGPAHNRHKNRP